jgi:hypothetical protein
MAAIFPVASPFNTSPSYSGTFIPSVWSAKLNAKFYAASVYADIANTDWQGEVSGMGDKVIINTAPTISVADYTVGAGLTYGAPTPSTLELLIDKGKYFAFQVNDVLEYQSKPNLIDMFSTDAAEQMTIAIDSNVIYNTFSTAAAANKGATAGVKSASYDLGTDAAPIALTKDNVVQKVLELASVLDEQNVPSEGRYLVIDPQPVRCCSSLSWPKPTLLVTLRARFATVRSVLSTASRSMCPTSCPAALRALPPTGLPVTAPRPASPALALC